MPATVPVPETTVKSVTPFGKTIDLVWETKHQSCVTGYRIKVNSTRSGLVLDEELPSTALSYEIGSLRPCTFYHVKLVTRYGQSQEQIIALNETTTLENVQADEFNFTLTAGNRVEFRWSHVEDVDRCDSEYRVRLTSLDGHEFLLPQQMSVPYRNNSVTFAHVEACVRYNVTLTANDFDVIAQIANLETNFRQPSPMKEPHIDKQHLRLRWSDPDANRYCVANYSVLLDNKMLVTRSNSLDISELERCAEYAALIYWFDKNDTKSDMIRIDFRMDFDVVRGQVTPIRSAVDDGALSVSWTPLPHRANCNILYAVTWNGDQRPTNTPDHNVTIDRFQYCKENKLEIRMIRDRQQSEPTQEIIRQAVLCKSAP